MTDDFTDDLLAYPHLVGLGAAVEGELSYRTLPGLCDVLVAAGAQTAFDECSTACEGMAWTRLSTAFSSANFPTPDLAVTGSGLLLAQTFEVGIVRGIELPDDPREGMDAEVLKAATRVQMADMSAMLAAICGYFSERETPFLVHNYIPIGPAGACVGGSWTVSAQTAFGV